MNATEAKALTDEFLRGARATPKGAKIDECLQCGTCSASCPTSRAMSLSPRAVLASIRAGRLDTVLASNTAWFCASCYSCAVRCPAGIPITDLMYRIKRLGIENGLAPRKASGATMAQSFVATVDRYGRSSEMTLMRAYFLRTGPLAALAQLPLGWRLFRRGRLGLRPRRIAGLASLRTMMAAMEKEGSR